jgi:hypothetical protein
MGSHNGSKWSVVACVVCTRRRHLHAFVRPSAPCTQVDMGSIEVLAPPSVTSGGDMQLQAQHAGVQVPLPVPDADVTMNVLVGSSAEAHAPFGKVSFGRACSMRLDAATVRCAGCMRSSRVVGGGGGIGGIQGGVAGEGEGTGSCQCTHLYHHLVWRGFCSRGACWAACWEGGGSFKGRGACGRAVCSVRTGGTVTVAHSLTRAGPAGAPPASATCRLACIST